MLWELPHLCFQLMLISCVQTRSPILNWLPRKRWSRFARTPRVDGWTDCAGTPARCTKQKRTPGSSSKSFPWLHPPPQKKSSLPHPPEKKRKREKKNLSGSTNWLHICRKLEIEIETRRIAVREDRKIHADLGIKQRLLDMILCYNPLWLRIGLEVSQVDTSKFSWQFWRITCTNSQQTLHWWHRRSSPALIKSSFHWVYLCNFFSDNIRRNPAHWLKHWHHRNVAIHRGSFVGEPRHSSGLFTSYCSASVCWRWVWTAHCFVHLKDGKTVKTT